ncbi:RsmE family RNA methyltransferase [Persephonella sp.]
MGYPVFIGKVEDGRFYITGEELHHARVKRIKTSHKILVNNLKGSLYLCQIEQITKKELTGKVLEKRAFPEKKLKIQLFLGMPNRLSKIDDLMEPITELGVSTLIPVITQNTAVKKEHIIKKIPKWQKISLNSIKQCLRPFPVEIKEPVYTGQIDTDAEKKIVFYEKEKTNRLKKEEGVSCVAVFIGAEGGITEEEIKLLQEKGFKPYTLGQYILKMETAVITGICQVNFSFDIV